MKKNVPTGQFQRLIYLRYCDSEKIFMQLFSHDNDKLKGELNQIKLLRYVIKNVSFPIIENSLHIQWRKYLDKYDTEYKIVKRKN